MLVYTSPITILINKYTPILLSNKHTLFDSSFIYAHLHKVHLKTSASCTDSEHHYSISIQNMHLYNVDIQYKEIALQSKEFYNKIQRTLCLKIFLNFPESLLHVIYKILSLFGCHLHSFRSFMSVGYKCGGIMN